MDTVKLTYEQWEIVCDALRYQYSLCGDDDCPDNDEINCQIANDIQNQVQGDWYK